VNDARREPSAFWRLLILGSRACAVCVLAAACTTPGSSPQTAVLAPRNLVLITIDTMRPDHVGAYGCAAARTPTLDRLAREGTRFDRAFAVAPITLTSHASLLTGLYPPGHGARHNGTAVRDDVPTLATVLRDRGYATAAFVAAFPLDHRFGLARGFDAYGDRMPRRADGRLANERPGSSVVDDALAWLSAERQSHAQRPFFLWVHLFEPHAPYGDPERDAGLPALVRYDREIAVADREAGRLVAGLQPDIDRTVIVAASDHGEAFGEHGESGHSLFVYDTTLRVALIIAGAGVPKARVVTGPVSLIDVAPTLLPLLGGGRLDADGVDLSPAMAGRPLPARGLYAESFAPLLDFGWSPLRAMRDGGWKAIAAPRSELYDVGRDPGETEDRARGTTGNEASRLRGLLERIDRVSADALPARTASPASSDSLGRLGALGYVQGGGRVPTGAKPDPKDRLELASRIAGVTSGETTGDARLAALVAIVGEDPGNGQMQMRLGDEWLARGRRGDAERHFKAAIVAGLPSTDPYLGLAACQADGGRVADAVATLRTALRIGADDPVVLANLGLLLARTGKPDDGVTALRDAVRLDPDFLEARFNLAVALARAGRRPEAAAAARELLDRLPAGAPQRTEVQRLLSALK
jgi:choline-sulfatase